VVLGVQLDGMSFATLMRVAKHCFIR